MVFSTKNDHTNISFQYFTRILRDLLLPSKCFNFLRKNILKNLIFFQILADLFEKLSETNQSIDLFPYVKRCALDIICGLFRKKKRRKEKREEARKGRGKRGGGVGRRRGRGERKENLIDHSFSRNRNGYSNQFTNREKCRLCTSG